MSTFDFLFSRVGSGWSGGGAAGRVGSTGGSLGAGLGVSSAAGVGADAASVGVGDAEVAEVAEVAVAEDSSSGAGAVEGVVGSPAGAATGCAHPVDVRVRLVARSATGTECNFFTMYSVLEWAKLREAQAVALLGV